MYICDFCSDSNVKWAFPASDCGVIIVSDDNILCNMSEGGWASCDACHDLILAEKREELLNRSIEAFKRLHGHEVPENEHRFIKPMVKTIHNSFWENMTGKCHQVLIANLIKKGGEADGDEGLEDAT